MKEFLQGRRMGFALRSHLCFAAAGLGLAVTVTDLMAWLALGARETNGYVIVAEWLCVATFLVVGFGAIAAVAERWDVIPEERGLAQVDVLAAIAAVAERWDVIPEERGLAQIDVLAAIGALLLYGISAVLRSLELGAVAASPTPFLLAVAGLIVLVVDAGLAANMYSSREWEEIEEEPVHERHRRRRA